MRDPDEADTLPGSVDESTRGVDSVLGRDVAMVSLPPAHGAALTVRTEQVRRLAALHHPNLIEVYDVDGLAEDVASTLVLQSVDGRSLDAVVDVAPWPAVSVAHVGAQVADGLAHAHGHGVVHGGIGPASIVVDETLHAWLTGFTAALRPGAVATPTTVVGHPAPSPTEDVVALGATLRALLDTSTPVPAVLDDALGAMAAGRYDARQATSALAEAAETCAHDDAAGGVVPMGVYSARISTGPFSAQDASAASSGPPSPSQPSPLPAAAAAALVAGRRADDAPAGPSPAPTPVAVRPAPRRSGDQAGRGLRVAALSAATMAVAVASGAVLWATNSFSAPLPAPAGASQGSPAVVAGPALGPAAPPPAGVDTGVAVPGDARPPLFDVTTLGSTQEAPSSAASEGADPAGRSDDDTRPGFPWFQHGPPDLPPWHGPDGGRPPHQPPWTPPPTTTPPTTTPPTTTPPTTTPPTTTPPTTTPPTTTPPTTTPPTTTPPTSTTKPTTPKPPSTTKPTTTKPTTTKPTTTKPTGSGAGGQELGQGVTGTGNAAPGAGVAPSARAAGPVSPTPAVVASGR